jgi:hypothetical protein
VKNSEDGVTYDFYRILDLTGQDTSNPTDNKYDAVVYKLNNTWKNFWTGTASNPGPGAAYIVANNTGNLATINIDGTIKYINHRKQSRGVYERSYEVCN